MPRLPTRRNAVVFSLVHATRARRTKCAAVSTSKIVIMPGMPSFFPARPARRITWEGKICVFWRKAWTQPARSKLSITPTLTSARTFPLKTSVPPWGVNRMPPLSRSIRWTTWSLTRRPSTWAGPNCFAGTAGRKPLCRWQNTPGNGRSNLTQSTGQAVELRRAGAVQQEAWAPGTKRLAATACTVYHRHSSVEDSVTGKKTPTRRTRCNPDHS